MMPFTEALFPSQAHGYATDEFEVTVERLGVYLPVCMHFDTALGDHSKKIYLGGTHRQPQGLW
jgi:Heterokaryon incompatibility protein Het-C